MLSTEVEGVGRWFPWNKTTAALGPKQPGIYIFRMVGCATAITRLTGMSDIIYVGSTPKGGTICGRLGDHLLTREDQKDVGWKIERVLKAVGALEVGWKVFSTADQAANYESEILWRYERDHIELPPLNSQMPQKTDRLNEEVVQQALIRLPAEQVASLLFSLDPTKLREVRAVLVTMGKLTV